MITDTQAAGELDHYFLNADDTGVGDAGGLLQSVAAGNFYLAFHTAWLARDGAQDENEVSYTGYARAAVPRTAGGFSRSGRIISLVADRFCGANQDLSSGIVAPFWSLGDDVSGAGKRRWQGVVSGSGVTPKTFTATDTGDLITSPGHGLTNNDRVVLWAIDQTTFPAGLTEGTVYHVISVSGNTYQVSLTQGGAAVTITADGAGRAIRCVPIAIDENVNPGLQAGSVINQLG